MNLEREREGEVRFEWYCGGMGGGYFFLINFISFH